MNDSGLLPSGIKRIELIEMLGIVKRFPGVLANNNIDFDVKSGEIHALLGENGAGKSTLMKILYGLYHFDKGEIRIDGNPVNIQSPSDAISLGIGMIHQHFMLVPTLTVAENVALGLQTSRGPFTEIEAVSRRIIELAGVYGLQVDPDVYVWQLSVGQQQRVEIIKALYRGAALLILDEPTAVLTPQEVDELFVIFRQMASDGYAMIFISHKLHEVLNITDRVTVLRDGQVVGNRKTAETTKKDLANLMVGREILMAPGKAPFEGGQTRLSIKDLWAESNRGTQALQGINLDIHSGEILGLAGVSGNGQSELAEVINGLRPATRGKVMLDSKDVTNTQTSILIKDGISYIPEERMRDGMIKDFSVSENIILRDVSRKPVSNYSFLNFKEIEHQTEKLITDFNVKTPSQDTKVKNLSGGNIQKLVLARELSRKPGVLIASQPTRGLDIGATEYVHQQLLLQRSEGTATLLISEDLDEILALSDRIAVIYEGRIMGEVVSNDATPQQLGLMMAGVATELENQ